MTTCTHTHTVAVNQPLLAWTRKCTECNTYGMNDLGATEEESPAQDKDEILRIFTGKNEPTPSTLVAIGPQECARCEDRTGQALIDDVYLVDDPKEATSALCPRCAMNDDPLHIVRSWLLTWN